MDETSENLHLHSYLNEILPTLGLDSETYSPYIMGCVASNEHDEGIETLSEELGEIIELLRASSETHSDDETTWDEFKSKVINHHREYIKYLKEKKDAEMLELKKVGILSIVYYLEWQNGCFDSHLCQLLFCKKAEEIRHQQEIIDAMEAQREMESRKQRNETKEISAAKKALLDQYAYDTSELYDKDGNVIDITTNSKGKDVNKADEDLSNREVANKVNAEKAQTLRKGHNTTSKQEERIKTKNAKLDKLKQKEERRQRATKGERRR